MACTRICKQNTYTHRIIKYKIVKINRRDRCRRGDTSIRPVTETEASCQSSDCFLTQAAGRACLWYQFLCDRQLFSHLQLHLQTFLLQSALALLVGEAGCQDTHLSLSSCLLELPPGYRLRAVASGCIKWSGNRKRDGLIVALMRVQFL